MPDVIVSVSEAGEASESRLPAQVDTSHVHVDMPEGVQLVEQVPEQSSASRILDLDVGLDARPLHERPDVEFPSLQDSAQHKRGRGRPAKQKKDDGKALLMGKIQGRKKELLAKVFPVSDVKEEKMKRQGLWRQKQASEYMRGVFVFINYVSKRIQPSTLRKAFQEYGNVTDVYIAYYNPRRIRFESTFAFVRFSSVFEAMNAVELENNRKMDGFYIRVYLDRKPSVVLKGYKEEPNLSIKNNPVRIDLTKKKDGRSYKEVLMSKKNYCQEEIAGKNQMDRKMKHCPEEFVGKSRNEQPNFLNQTKEAECKRLTKDPLVIKEVDKQWLKSCIIGQVSCMYDQMFVQQMLQSEGFKVKVSCWSGYYMIIQFEEEEQIDIFWDLKDSLLKPWFCEVESVENFMMAKKLRVWACIEGLPLELEVWNDTNTAEKNRLDVARILMGVGSLSSIPPFVSIDVNGEVYNLKVYTHEYEDERCWIDGEMVNSHVGGSPKSAGNSLDGSRESGRLEKVHMSRENEKFYCRTWREGAGESNTIFDDKANIWQKEGLPNVPLLSINKSGGVELSGEAGELADSISFRQSSSEGTNKAGCLHEVLIQSASDSYHSQGNSGALFRSFNWSFYNQTQNGERAKLLWRIENMLKEGILKNSAEEVPLAEARATFEVCEKLGLLFKAEKEVVVEKLLEIEKRRAEKKAAVRRVLVRNRARKPNYNVLHKQRWLRYVGFRNNFNFCFSPSRGAAGGLISLWDPEFFYYEDSVIGQNFILIRGKISKPEFKCVLINVYGPNESRERDAFLNELRSRANNFNLVRHPEERIGVGSNRVEMKIFTEFINSLGLVDIPLQDRHFTWSNFRDKPSFSRLDRFLIDGRILCHWQDLFQELLPKSLSDHNPICLSIMSTNWGPRPFKWFDHLLDDKSYVKRIHEECCNANGIGIDNLLRKCKMISKEWSSTKERKSVESICELETDCLELEKKIEGGNTDPHRCDKLRRMRRKLWEANRREEREWIQKSRLRWAVEGDRNTKFFHLVASARRRSNFINCLKVVANVINNPAEVKKAIELHFKDFYNKSLTIPIKSFECSLNKLSSESAERLEKPFCEEEVFAALLSLENSKAPGPDGFNMGFLKKIWSSLKAEVMDFFENFFKGNITDFSFNHSFIVLIPKSTNLVGIEEYRPISLVGCIYKLLSKVLAMRLRKVLNERLEGVVLKADFSKAYDTVDWDFLMVIMQKMGFGEVWCHWILLCISSAYISVLVNGSPTTPFAIGRGLRQGCPLSPLLFNIIGEALSALIHKANAKGYFKGLKVGQTEMEITRIQFVDDLMFFCEADEMQIKNIIRILKGFELAAGLKLNLSKTKLIGINVDEQRIDQWAKILHCQSEKFSSWYLALPLGAKRISISIWEPIVERVETKLTSWKSKLLSFGGRLKLIKSVLNGLPVYFMTMFPMPTSINNRISSLVARFLWGSLTNKAIHWVSWERLILPKHYGGLGLLNFKTKNRALLNKWLWRYGAETNRLWRRVIDAKYDENHNSLLPSNVNNARKSWI
ncbi:hypothetical protein GQ457_05G016460 [Hibiscus cannabinus]